MNKENINLFYAIALQEGEGFGTAYEYLVKSHLINRLFKKIENPKNILIAGLPEKYGFGLDYVLLANLYGCKIDIIDERNEIIENFNNTLKDLAESNLLISDNIKTQKVEELEDIDIGIDKYYEVALSSAVLQRIKEESRCNYLRKLSEKVKYILLFVPNKGNKAHPRQTGLNPLSIEDLLGYSKKSNVKVFILDAGKIDLPPFSPGIKASAKLRNLIENKKIRRIFMKFLGIWAYLESLFPKIIKNRFAHMIYLMLEFKNERDY